MNNSNKDYKAIILPSEIVEIIETNLRSKLDDKILDKIYVFLNTLQQKYYFNKKSYVQYHNISSNFLKTLFGKFKIEDCDKYKEYNYAIELLESLKVIKVNNSYSNSENKSFTKSYCINFYHNLYKKNLFNYNLFLNIKLNYNILYNNINKLFSSSTSYVSKIENTEFTIIKVSKKIYNKPSEALKKKYKEIDTLIVEQQTNLLKRLEINIPKSLDVSVFQYEFIEKIKNKEIYCFQDDFSGRLHSNITSLRKEYRDYLTIDGEKLIEIDIRNSQSVFLAKRIKKELGSNISYNQYEFIKEAEKGTLYDFIADLIISKEKDLRDHDEVREEVKLNLQKLYFSDDYKHISKFHKLFKDMFPDVLTFINTIKSKSSTGGKEFACLLQSLEKRTILNIILPKAYELGIDALTIHDSFLVKVSQAKELELIIKEEELPIKIKQHNMSSIDEILKRIELDKIQTQTEDNISDVDKILQRIKQEEKVRETYDFVKVEDDEELSPIEKLLRGEKLRDEDDLDCDF